MIAIGLVRELGRLGVLVGRYPLISILIGVIVTVPGFLGFLRFELDMEMNGGFVSLSAPSHAEIADQQSFFDARGLPWYMALFGRSEDNLLDDKPYAELNKFYETSMNMNLTIDDGNEYYQFRQLCHPLCGINVQLQKLMEINWFADMKYPVSRAMGYDLNIGKHVFNRTIKNGKLSGAKLMAFYYTSLIKDPAGRLKLENFDRKINELALEHNRNESNRVKLTILGTNTAGGEIARGFKDTMKLTVGSVFVASLLFLLFVWFSAWMKAKLTCTRMLFGIVSLSIAPLALLSGCGLACLIGAKINMLFVMAPIGTLVFISHLQNVFLLLNKFDGLELEAKRNQYNRSEIIGATFEQITPINIITNLGIMVGFGASRFFLPYSYADYSLGIAFSLLIVWIVEFLILGGLLSFECSCTGAPGKYYEKPNAAKRTSILYNCSINWNKFLFRPYSMIICSIPGRLIGILLLLLFAGLPGHWGIRSLRSSMDFRRFIPTDSPANKGFDVMDTIWNDFHQIVFIVNKPSNFSDYGEYMEFRKFISDIEAIPNVLNGSSHMSWVFDYFKAELNIDFFSENASLQAPNMSKFHNFITTFPYEAWADGTKFEFLDTEKKMPKINRMVVMAAFHRIKGLEGKRSLINLCRHVARKNPQLQISAFDTDSRSADIIDNVIPTFFRWSLILIVFCTIIPLATLWNFAASVLCLLGCSYFLGSVYALHGLLDIPLDLLSMTTLITVSAIGIRIALHLIGEFLLVWAHDDKTCCALQNSAGIVLKTAFFTFILVGIQFPLGTVPLFIQHALMTSIVLVTSIIISFFLLPLSSGLLPTRIISLETFC